MLDNSLDMAMDLAKGASGASLAVFLIKFLISKILNRFEAVVKEVVEIKGDLIKVMTRLEEFSKSHQTIRDLDRKTIKELDRKVIALETKVNNGRFFREKR